MPAPLRPAPAAGPHGAIWGGASGGTWVPQAPLCVVIQQPWRLTPNRWLTTVYIYVLLQMWSPTS